MDTPLRGVLLSNVPHIFLTPDKGEFVISFVGGDIRLNQLMVNDKVSAKKSIDLKVS